jgi:putative membrane protein
MDYLIQLLFWIHLVSLAVGGAAVFGIPIVGSRVPSATPEMRPVLFGIADRLSGIGRVALILLVITGPLMLWLKYGGPSGLSWWFWVKMSFVVLLIGLVIYAGMNAKKAQTGDMAAAKRAPMVSMIGVALYLLVIASAVLTFG